MKTTQFFGQSKGKFFEVYFNGSVISFRVRVPGFKWSQLKPTTAKSLADGVKQAVAWIESSFR